MGATSTTVKTRGRRRGRRQRAAAGSLPSFCPALCLTPHFASWLKYVAVVERFGCRGRVKRRVKQRVKHSFSKPFTFCFTRQDVKGRLRMALIERQKKAEMVPLRIKLEREHHDRLVRYAEFLESSTDHIIAQTLDFVIRRDREFAAVEARSQAKQAAPGQGRRPQAKDDQE